MPPEATQILEQRRRRIARLRERFTAMNLRSRSLRLLRCAKSGALDLGRLGAVAPEALAELTACLGRDTDDTRLVLCDRQSSEEPGASLADDLATLARRERGDWLETGLRSLAIGWPFLEGRTADGTWLRSPILLYPARLETTTRGRLQWVLRLEEPPRLNEALALTLLRLAGVALSLEELLEDDDDKVFAVDAPTWISFHACLTRLGLVLEPPAQRVPSLDPVLPRTEADRDQAPTGRFFLRHHLVLGRFPPSGSSVVGDYEELLERTLDDETLGRAADLLATDEPVVSTPEADAAADAEARRPPLPGSRRHLALRSDSSQDELLRWLDDGVSHGVVVQGPPGTGKSQLISNLLTAGIAEGLRILVVCEKRAALDVVADRLASAGLGEPLALVHDVGQDRTRVCRDIARSIDDRQTAGLDESSARSRHDKHLERFRARLALSDEAWEALARSAEGRPALADLYERALDDDGRPLPDLASTADGVTEGQAESLLPRVEALSTETERLAAPHALAVRGDWSTKDQHDLEAVRSALKGVLVAIAALQRPAGSMTAAQACALGPLWQQAEGLLQVFDGADAHELGRFLLFWAWTNGRAAHGPWHEVMQRLTDAKRRLRPAPYELVLTPRDELERCLAGLDRLTTLRLRWYRGLAPPYWKLRRLPRRVLEGCPSIFEQAPALLQRDAAGGNVARLVETALGWQDLIEALPRDNPFLDFGLQGAPAEIDRAIADLRVQHDRVRAVHLLHEALRSRGAPYDTLPRFDGASDPQQEPFITAVLDDWRLVRRFEELGEAIATASELDAGLRPWLDEAKKLAARGQLDEAAAPIERALASWSDATEAARLDRLVAGDPPWVRRFLRGWRRNPDGGASAGQDARLALHRSWRALILAGRSRPTLEAPLADETSLEALEAELTACRQAAAASVIAAYHERLTSRVRSAEQGPALRRLAAQARKRRRRLTLRQLVHELWNDGLAEVRPVWLCSPNSVASMFPVARDLFDLVIFDEASQCPVEAALPVVLRGRRILVAGDDQQLPPSAFFQATHGIDPEDEDSSVLASQSLLELARVAYDARTLRWHYRSRHEELITFSNRAFYGGRLITAPRAQGETVPLVEGVHWCQVRGRWREQENHAEAEQVVDLVHDLLSTSRNGTPPSVGVVTFNLRQAELIERLLDRRALNDSSLRDALSRDGRRPAIEQLFVRNLENVQGDERDVILFSPAYGPQKVGGPVHARFGPLGLAGGEKRLNVAITRARVGVWVVASFEPERLDVSGTRHLGPKLFKNYLLYVKALSEGRTNEAAVTLERSAELGGGDWAAPATQRAGRPRVGLRVRTEVGRALLERGLAVATEHGLGSRRIDLAVGREPGDYRVAVDCGAFLATADPLTRDVYAPAYWRHLGWRLLRVTPGAWLESPEQVLARIDEALARTAAARPLR